MTLDEIDFFEECNVKNSDFDKAFASLNDNWNLLKEKYNLALKQKINQTIPKIIHFIWIGSKIPETYIKNIQDWKQKNPLFEIKIWDDITLIPFLQEKRSYKQFIDAKNFGNKSDIARYEILKSFGGLYLDTDFMCLSNEFNWLHDNLSFYTCVSFERNVNIFNGMIASIPNHPVINLCLDNCNVNGFLNVSCEQTRALYQTGPYLFTSCVLHHLKNTETQREVVFPSKFFYPVPAILKDQISDNLLNSFMSKNTMACHLWHSSWQPKSKFFNGQSL